MREYVDLFLLLTYYVKVEKRENECGRCARNMKSRKRSTYVIKTQHSSYDGNVKSSLNAVSSL